jgi:hypothetical protein
MGRLISIELILFINRKVTFQAIQKLYPRCSANIPCDVDGFKISIIDLDPNRLALEHDAIRRRHVVIYMGGFFICNSNYEMSFRESAGAPGTMRPALVHQCPSVRTSQPAMSSVGRRAISSAVIMILAAIFNTVFFWR